MVLLLAALPVIVAVPLLGELLHLPRAQLPVLMASLLLGTPVLSLLGAVVAALTVGMRRAGVLVALLALATGFILWKFKAVKEPLVVIAAALIGMAVYPLMRP